MDNENYETLLAKIEELENRINDSQKHVNDIVEFNKTLLNTKQVVNTQKENTNDINKRIGDYINECKNNK